MEVKINKEIRDYTEAVYFGLSLRQCVFSALACAAAVEVYFGLKDLLGTEIVTWLCVLAALPFAFFGFFKYHGMNAEQFLYAFIKSELLIPRRLLFQAKSAYYEAYQANKRKVKQSYVKNLTDRFKRR